MACRDLGKQSALAIRTLYLYVSIRCAQQRLSYSRENMSYHSPLAVEDSFLDKDQTAGPAEAGASGGEVDLAVAADLARVAPGQGYLAPEDLP